jgi:hypothetical protein
MNLTPAQLSVETKLIGNQHQQIRPPFGLRRLFVCAAFSSAVRRRQLPQRDQETLVD